MSDLLDLFRRANESEEEGKRASKQPKRATKAKSTSGARSTSGAKPKKRKKTVARASDETVLALTRRQMLYAASGQVILLGLAFLVGLTFGKGDSLNRQTQVSAPNVKIWIVAELPPTNGLGNQRPVDIQQIIHRLTTLHEFDRGMVFPHKTDHGYKIAIGPFPSDAAARAFVDDRKLGQFRAAGRLPFQKPFIGVPQR